MVFIPLAEVGDSAKAASLIAAIFAISPSCALKSYWQPK
jgi:hypothetical protein